MDLWWQGVIAIGVIACIVFAEIFLFRFLFRRSKGHWLSSRPTLSSVTVTVAVWSCCLGVVLSFQHNTISPADRFPNPHESLWTPNRAESLEVEAQVLDSLRLRSKLDALVGEALDLTKGKIAFDVPPEMRQGEPQSADVRIARGVDQDITNLLTDKLRKTAQVEDIQVAPFMIVMLDADKSIFEIMPLTKDKQLVTGDGYTTWAWAVKPLQSGKCTLYLTVGTRVTFPNHEEETKFRPLYQREISVQVDRMYEAKQFLSGNWQWIIATLLLPLAGFIWHHWKRKPKETPLLP